MGRCKIPIKRIEDGPSMNRSFSKRREGLFRKACALSKLTGCQIAILVISPKKRHPYYCQAGPCNASFDSIVRCYINATTTTSNYIEERRKRYAKFNKRRNGLFKKARELSILCHIPVGVIIISAAGCPYCFAAAPGSNICIEDFLLRYYFTTIAASSHSTAPLDITARLTHITTEHLSPSSSHDHDEYHLTQGTASPPFTTSTHSLTTTHGLDLDARRQIAAQPERDVAAGEGCSSWFQTKELDLDALYEFIARPERDVAAGEGCSSWFDTTASSPISFDCHLTEQAILVQSR